MPVGISTATMSVVALVFGAVWLYMNVYTFSPVYRKAFARLIGRSANPRVYGEGTDLPDEELPSIDVLVPAYDEYETLGHAVRALREADYPDDKLNVSIVVEPFDRVTRDEISRLRRIYDFKEIAVPPSYPGKRNKPRALNYAFEVTDGDVVGVIDAEDIVADSLFRQVARALVEGEHDYVQGRLDMQNEDDGLLNTLFRGEYGFWYGTIIPSFFRVRYPVPLGGTTNFAWREVLEEASDLRLERFGSPWVETERDALESSGYEGTAPWDPRNVTEDFELGILLWETGKSMAMVEAVTREESPVGINGWVRQRTRWQKGKLFTLIQRLRYPPKGVRKKVHVYTQSAVPHLGPINIVGVILIAIYANLVGFLASPVVAGVLILGLAMVVQHMALQAYGYLSFTDARGLRRARRTAYNFVGLPLYWGIIWGSDVRAFIQLASDSIRWEKTEHVGRHIVDEDLTAVESTMSAVGLRLVVYEKDIGDEPCWTWRLDEGTETVVQACTVFENELDAKADAETFNDTLPVAVGSDAVFEVLRDSKVDGNGDERWTWSLLDDGTSVAVAPSYLSNEKMTRENVGRVKTVAGISMNTDAGAGGGADAVAVETVETTEEGGDSTVSGGAEYEDDSTATVVQADSDEETHT